MIRRSFVFACLAMILSACASVPPPALGPSDFEKFRIADVVVEGVEVIRSWPRQEEAFAKANATDPETVDRLRTEPASSFPAVRAHLQRALDQQFRAEFASKVSPIFSGRRPLRAVVRLRVFDVPSTLLRVFVQEISQFRADIDLVDVASGAPVLSYEGLLYIKRLPAGIALAFEQSDPGADQITYFMTAYRNWLLQN
jgi:hypothetical protein